MSPLVLEKYAAQFRAENGYNNRESIHLNSLLHKLEVLAVFRPLEMEVSGMAIKVGESNRFMLINTSRTLGHQHFKVCHELYHLFNNNQCSTLNAQGLTCLPIFEHWTSASASDTVHPTSSPAPTSLYFRSFHIF